MASVYARRRRLWCRLKDESGRWISKKTPYDVGQEKLADEYARKAQALLDARREAPASDTVRGYATGRWIKKRRELDLDWKNDRGHLAYHVLPAIGDLRLAEVRTRHLIDLIHQIRTVPRKGKTKVPAPRTVYNIYSTLSAMFRDAKLDGLIETSPCVLTDAQLGPKVDAKKGWRKSAVFTRDEVEIIISTNAIPQDRRVAYGLELLGGLRPGESSALRWRHYDPMTEHLGQLHVAHAFNTKKHREKGTKTESERFIPVHPILAAMLAEWKLSGWLAMMGRSPGPDDLIIPLPPADLARRRSRTGEAYRPHDYSGRRWREDDLPALGWRHRRHYDMRATFITLALDDGADPTIIRERVTHARPNSTAFDGYNRGLQWARTCAEVSKLKVARREPCYTLATVVPFLVETGGAGDGIRTRGSERARPLDVAVLDGGDMPEVDPRDVPRLPGVTSLATRLADAVLVGDHELARQLALQMQRDCNPENASTASPQAHRRRGPR